MDPKILSARCVVALMIIAAIVFVGQCLKGNVWLLVCLYWLVLTVKNYADWSGRQ
jgi:hypothetical protein